MYDTDSFHTLSGLAQFGLLAVSATFAFALARTVRVTARGRHVFMRLAIWGLVFYLFIWLSPQGYYAYYMLIIDGLPRQWIIGTPTSLSEIAQFLTFTGPVTLSAHSLGILGWVLLILALWPHRSNCRDAAN